MHLRLLAEALHAKEILMDEVTITIDVFWIVLVVSLIGLVIVGAVAFFAWRAFSDDSKGFVDYELYLDFFNI